MKRKKIKGGNEMKQKRISRAKFTYIVNISKWREFLSKMTCVC